MFFSVQPPLSDVSLATTYLYRDVPFALWHLRRLLTAGYAHLGQIHNFLPSPALKSRFESPTPSPRRHACHEYPSR